ncbi:MAG: amidinotransferase [Ignavibacteria bacterium]|nr:amidinotransferase [Ignavibacteria bacterium]
MSSTQSTNHVIMVRPACFCFNTETAISNAFQNKQYADLSAAEKIQQQAVIEFNRMVEQLRSHGVHVDVFDDTPSPIKPDAIFPNNWFSTHADGTIILYPMLAENRRLERNEDLIKNLSQTHQVTAIIDLSVYTQRNQYLEGTGSLVLDRINKIVYATRSPRTHELIVEHFTKLMNYQQPAILFDSVDDHQKAIYHTNVMMAIGTYVAIICLESIVDKEQRKIIVKSLEQNGKRKIIDITLEQMKHFAGNMLEIQNKQGEYLLAMSKSAYDCLTDEQRDVIEKANTKLICFDVSTIEQCGGGSVRCMIAENFLSQNI